MPRTLLLAPLLLACEITLPPPRSTSPVAHLDTVCALRHSTAKLKSDPAALAQLVGGDPQKALAANKRLREEGYDALRAEADGLGVEGWSCPAFDQPTRTLPALPGPTVRVTPKHIRVEGDAAPLPESTLDAAVAAHPKLKQGFTLDVRTDAPTGRVQALFEATAKAGITRVNLVIPDRGHGYALRIPPWHAAVDCAGKQLPFRVLATTEADHAHLAVVLTRANDVLIGATGGLLPASRDPEDVTFPTGTDADVERILGMVEGIRRAYPDTEPLFAGERATPFRRTVYPKLVEESARSQSFAFAGVACPERDATKASDFKIVPTPPPAPPKPAERTKLDVSHDADGNLVTVRDVRENTILACLEVLELPQPDSLPAVKLRLVRPRKEPTRPRIDLLPAGALAPVVEKCVIDALRYEL